MKKAFSIFVLCIFCMGALSGCGSKLPEGMDKETILASAHTVIEALDNKDYAVAVDMMDETMAEALPADRLAEVWEPIAEKAGAFVEYSKEAVTGKDGWGVAVVVAKYEFGSVQFTLSFDGDMQLGGLYLK